MLEAMLDDMQKLLHLFVRDHAHLQPSRHLLLLHLKQHCRQLHCANLADLMSADTVVLQQLMCSLQFHAGLVHNILARIAGKAITLKKAVANCVMRVNEGNHGEEIEDHASVNLHRSKRKIGRQQLSDLDQNAALSLEQAALKDLPVVQSQGGKVVGCVNAGQKQLCSFSSSRQHPAVHEVNVFCTEHGKEEFAVNNALLVSAACGHAIPLL
mmetsp:Transcript_12272/g.29276  ORF Transcript_12272/g.29276 Transcript_12272/m.29276 type:complete len:212 (+) Transcript_12272:235-870(+)